MNASEKKATTPAMMSLVLGTIPFGSNSMCTVSMGATNLFQTYIYVKGLFVFGFDALFPVLLHFFRMKQATAIKAHIKARNNPLPAYGF